MSIMAVPRPRGTPSDFRNTMLRADPPAVPGVMAEVKSHSSDTRRHFHHVSFSRVSNRKRHVSPHWRTTTHITARATAPAALPSSGMLRNASMLNSRAKSHATTARPITTGAIVFNIMPDVFAMM